MLSIQSTKPQKCTPNLLPARLHHNGPINDTDRYWKPSTDHTGKQHAHFRGRHLHGTLLPLPANYSGAILHVTDKQLAQPQTTSKQMADHDAQDQEEVDQVDVSVAHNIGQFDQILVWGHGGEVHGAQDAFVRGMTEWIGFAESVHVDADEEPANT